ncbi:MAG: Tat proofreading chaperone DmsD [Raoultibacter sp.]
MNEKLNDVNFCSQVMFVGESLGGFYLQDPEHGDITPAFAAIAALDVAEAAQDWPFVAPAAAASNLALMQEGLADGLGNEELIWEYRRLFIGPAPKPAPPWGSVYTDRECVVFGQTCLALRQWLREVGIQRTTDEQTPEDHIGILLLLMTWIAQNKPEVLEDFLRLHLLPWSSHFLTLLADCAEQPFYEGLARLTQASLEGLGSQLAIDVVHPKFYR